MDAMNRTARAIRKGSQGLAFGVIVTIIAALAFVSMANGQSVITGSISGTVVDSSGAVVVGAQVQIISETTHFVTPATSNKSGFYTGRFLQPGFYDVKIAVTGFDPKEETGVELLPSAIKEVDFKLLPGSVSATVQVTANQEMLQRSEERGVGK